MLFRSSIFLVLVRLTAHVTTCYCQSVTLQDNKHVLFVFQSDTIEIEDAKGVLQRIFPSITVTGSVVSTEREQERETERERERERLLK